MPASLRRRALLIGNETYAHVKYPALPSVRADVALLHQALLHPQVGGFTEVRPVFDPTAAQMCAEIEQFLQNCAQDELVMLYVSGHGTRLVQTDGMFHFVATDTDYDSVAASAVSSDFVARQLEECTAAQKVLMIDCCQSGGFTLGFRTADPLPVPKSAQTQSQEMPPVLSQGVYVLSSSRATEYSYAGEVDGEVAPSAFTGHVIETLCSGDAAEPDTGEVTIEGLFQHVGKRMARAGGASRGAAQTPVSSTLHIDGRIVVATRPHGRPVLTPITRRPDGTTTPIPHIGDPAVPTPPTWPSLLSYYRRCLQAKREQMPTLAVSDHGETHVCLTGSEPFLSGTVDNDHRIAVPAQAQQLVDATETANEELWAGYPAVVLPVQRSSRGRTQHHFVPLLVRRVEIVATEHGSRLQPTGPVLLHPKLVAEHHGDGTAPGPAGDYRPTWHAGQHSLMAKDIGHLLTQELEIATVQRLEPEQLSGFIDVDTALDGARNAAVLFRVSPNDPEKNLLKDLETIGARADSIKDTALAALSPDPRERTEPRTDARPFDIVTPLPCNEGQEAVIRSAMTRRLTVATGPPGTGKSQLVANLVATAVANGNTVLVASTNNQAVDEVHGRCDDLTPNSIVRTGKLEHLDGRDATLRALLEVRAPEHSLPTALAHLQNARESLQAEHQFLHTLGLRERLLLQAGTDREQHAAALGVDVGVLSRRLGARPEAVARKARSIRDARVFGGWRRTRLLTRFGVREAVTELAAGCEALHQFAVTESSWRAAFAGAQPVPDDAVVTAALRNTEQRVRDASTAVLEGAVHAAAVQGRNAISEFVNSKDRNNWRALKAVLPAARAWAVTTMSARRFPIDPGLFDLVVIDEASQCSIPHVLPLLYRAKRALIIGDPMQLAHIANGLTPKQEREIARDTQTGQAWLEDHRMSYRRHSSFRAAERSARTTLLLDEHFRCHPKIADLVNAEFYAGRLTVMTDIRSRPAVANSPAIDWIDVRGRAEQPNSGSSWYNRAEAELVVDTVKSLRSPGQLPEDATIGVVTPFRPQAEMIERMLGRGFADVRVGTVHAFQGGERDIMIYSLVATPNMRKGSINWVDSQLNLWNVAITRARSNLIVVGDRNLWSQRRLGGVLLRHVGDGTGDGLDSPPFDRLQRRLQRALGHNNARFAVSETVSGYRCDALVHTEDGRRTALVIDRGPSDPADSARHVRLMLGRREVLQDFDLGIAGVRVPGWKLFATRDWHWSQTHEETEVPPEEHGKFH
ncbi:AAA domain-containing protein [Nocardia halotolerans]|uniref:AAA domain-containing protein n=1 Tax=Nocardia halotolerans TaxID=1755878 RepID=A0ABV8VHG5_9NOCA